MLRDTRIPGAHRPDVAGPAARALQRRGSTSHRAYPRRAPDGKLLGLLVHDARDEAQVSSYLAERRHREAGRLSLSADAQWPHPDAASVEGATDVVIFQRYAIDINRFEQKADGSFLLRPRERTTSELLNPDPKDPSLEAWSRPLSFRIA